MSVAVVHLVRRANGPVPLKAFMASYREHQAGTDHRLLLVLKGFDAPPDLAAVMEGVEHEVMLIEDVGYDIGAYLRASKICREEEVLCFLNSFSQILANGWLNKLTNGLMAPGVGAAGATGSWESHHTSHLQGLFADERPRPLWRQALSPVKSRILGARFPEFPNHHLRTNAFVINRALWDRLEIPNVRRKRDAEGFESGYQSLTRRLEALGLSCVVVGRDSRVFPKERWGQSETFRRGDQGNLLVADNRTRQYQQADPQLRRTLELRAWGDLADDG